jgi:putative oxidoreductase
MSGIYIKSGWDVFREPGNRPEKAAKLGLRNPELMVRANGLGMALAGSALALGIKPRLSALALAGLMVPTTLAGHRFWEEPPGPGKSAQEVQFLKNLGLIGGLLLFASSPRR